MGCYKVCIRDYEFPWVGCYYRRFIEKISLLVASLTRFINKDVEFVWSEDCEASFVELKKRLTSAPVLTIPVPGGKLVVFTDASRVGLGCLDAVWEGCVLYFATVAAS